MPKEIRLNDKIWFGKYKGNPVKVILDGDRQFLENLILKGKITYGQNILDYLNENHKKTGIRKNYSISTDISPELSYEIRMIFNAPLDIQAG
jgi:hypothetical protein